MRFVVTTPTAVVLDAPDVVHIRAEDASGAFGILAGHADFLTVLEVSVVSFRDSRGAEHHVAVRGGVLRVHGGKTVEVGTREAVAGDDLAVLEKDVLAGFQSEAEAEAAERSRASRLQAAAIRQICRYLHTGQERGQMRLADVAEEQT